eukprot:1154746-Pelagomonas_calceolata.AAC.7
MGIRKVTSSTPCLILVMRVEKSLLKSAPGASKFISVLNRMKLQSNFVGLMSIKTMLCKGIQSVRGVDDPAQT